MRLVHMPLGVNCPEWMHKYLNGDWSGDSSEFANENRHTPAHGSWLHSKREVANHLFFKVKVTLLSILLNSGSSEKDLCVIYEATGSRCSMV